MEKGIPVCNTSSPIYILGGRNFFVLLLVLSSLYLSSVEAQELEISAYSHVVPEEIAVFPEQLSYDSVSVVLLAIFNNSKPMFMINSTEKNGNNLVINVYSTQAEDGDPNITATSAYATFNNLSIGDYIIEINEVSLEINIATIPFTLQPYGRFINRSDMIGTLGTFKGGIDNGTLYAMPFPTVPVCPPGLFEDTNFWANATDRFYLVISLENNGSEKQAINFSIYAPDENIYITPNQILINNLSSNASALCIFEIKNNNLSYGIYNLTYNLSYTETNTTYNIAGFMPMGVYEKYESWRDTFGNITTSTRLISPFGDDINCTTAGWTNLSVENESVWISSNITYDFKYSNYSLEEPNSPVPLLLVGAVAGGVICGGITAYEQWQAGEEIDWNKVAENGAKGAVGGALIGGTFGLAGAGTFGMALGGGTGAVATTAVYTGTGALLEYANQMVTYGEVQSIGDIASNAVLSGGSAALSYGAGHFVGAYIATANHVARGGGVGKWYDVTKFWNSGRYTDAMLRYSKYATTIVPATQKIVDPWLTAAEAYGNYLELKDSATYKYLIRSNFEDPTGKQEVITTEYARPSNSLYANDDYDKDGITNYNERISGSDPFDPSNQTRDSLQTAIIDAEIVDPIYWPKGAYLPGDEVNMIYAIKNTGTMAHDFYMGCSVNGPDGVWQDTAYKIIHDLEPNDTRLDRLAWTVPENATEGEYDITIAVWEDDTNGTLKGELDRETRYGMFVVGVIENSTIVLFDASGSMEDYNKIGEAKEFAKDYLTYNVNRNDEISLIVFYDCDLIKLEQPFTKNISAIDSMIDSITPYGGTPLYNAVQVAKEYMEGEAKGEHRKILLLTDGMETCGGEEISRYDPELHTVIFGGA